MVHNFSRRDRERVVSSYIQEIVRALPEYRRLTARRYREPSGYASYRSVCSEITKSIWNARFFPGNLDWVTEESAAIAYQIAQIEAPTLWLSNSLAAALKVTDIPSSLSEVRRVLPAGIIMLPNGLFQTPDHQDLTFIAWMHRLPGDEIINMDLGIQCQFIPTDKEHGQICWFSSLSNGDVYHGNIECLASGVAFGENDFDTNLQAFADVDEEAESDVVSMLGRLIVQALLVMQIRPDLVDEPQAAHATSGVGFGRVRGNSELWQPRWIGKDYVIREEKQSAPGNGGTHASPRPHWRKGHLRRVAVGSRAENQREWRWFEPTWIHPRTD